LRRSWRHLPGCVPRASRPAPSSHRRQARKTANLGGILTPRSHPQNRARSVLFTDAGHRIPRPIPAGTAIDASKVARTPGRGDGARIPPDSAHRLDRERVRLPPPPERKMEKLRLKLDALVVESFSPARTPPARGTVRGYVSLYWEDCSPSDTCP